ncbi:MAG: csaB [Clostridia bacterium]|jgi:polysaccharide pyruvyl transferase CsaB|nr:csaB [Clostridia bacterium]
MGNPKKIVLSGYYGFDNIGDEAVLYAILSQLRESMPEIRITVLSNNPEKTKLMYEVDAVNRWHIKEVIKVIKESDMLISGGGSLLQDVTSSKTIPYYLGIVKLAQWYKKKVVFYSQGIGPIEHGYNKWLTKKIVNKVDAIFVRDSHSKEVLEELGITKPINVAADPVLGIKPNGHVYKYVRDLLGEAKAVGVYIRPWENEEELISSLEKALQYVIREGYKVYLIPMYYLQDREIAHKLKNKLGENAIVVDKMLTIDEVVSYTACFEFIIGMRLHSLIMAAAQKVSMIGLSYDPKVRDFMKDMEIPYCIEVQHIGSNELIYMIQRLMDDKNALKIHLSTIYELKKQKLNLPVQYIAEQLI